MIENPWRKKQLLVMDKVRWGNITPTDLDVCLDFRGEHFVLGEVKYAGTELKPGQQMFLDALLSSLRKPVLGFVADHYVHNVHEDVKLDECEIRLVWWEGKWCKPRRRTTVLEAIRIARGQWGLPENDYANGKA